jgi:hypothetical protein
MNLLIFGESTVRGGASIEKGKKIPREELPLTLDRVEVGPWKKESS